MRQALARLPQGDPAAVRAFWAVVGASVADAAATQSHWNYKIEPFHATLKERGTYDVREMKFDIIIILDRCCMNLQLRSAFNK